jgi:membrane protease YdiL (CAAX protease family)
MKRNGIAAVLAGFVVLWIVLDRSAAALGSFRGEAGIAVCLVVLAAAVVVEMAIGGGGPGRALTALGVLRLPNGRALMWAVIVSLVLLCFHPLFSLVVGTAVSLQPGWYLLIAGLFAQGGLAEETVFRGFLFRHFRQGRRFWRAAVLAAIPFVAVHLLLFLSLEPAIALASVLLAVSISFPLAWLFERAGNAVWPPAIVHFVLQGSIKLVAVDESRFLTLAIAWMALSAVTPWLFFLMRARTP